MLFGLLTILSLLALPQLTFASGSLTVTNKTRYDFSLNLNMVYNAESCTLFCQLSLEPSGDEGIIAAKSNESRSWGWYAPNKATFVMVGKDGKSAPYAFELRALGTDNESQSEKVTFNNTFTLPGQRVGKKISFIINVKDQGDRQEATIDITEADN